MIYLDHGPRQRFRCRYRDITIRGRIGCALTMHSARDRVNAAAAVDSQADAWLCDISDAGVRRDRPRFTRSATCLPSWPGASGQCRSSPRTYSPAGLRRAAADKTSARR